MKHRIAILALLLLLPLFLLPAQNAWCHAFADSLHLNGAALSAKWVIPFIGMLLSIALGPMLAPHAWEKHHGKIAAFWGMAFLAPCALVLGPDTALYQAWHALVLEYAPFIILLLSLYTVAGGVRFTGTLAGTPAVNTLLLLIGTALASWMGTTGAAMLLIRLLIRVNEHRRYRVHTIVFFIFLVANIGGSLTPLGDPPLFLGFLKGVSFFWTAQHLLPPFLLLSCVLLLLFCVLDTILYAREGKPIAPQPHGPMQPDDVCTSQTAPQKFGLEGKVNLILLLGVIGAVLVSGNWKPGSLNVFHVDIELQNLARDAALLVITLLSLRLTSAESRRLNGFNWYPIQEVSKLFFGIFLSMIPAIAILQAGEQGALSGVIRLVSQNDAPDNVMYFWLTGLLSSFLDNAPTYMVFFNAAGGDASSLMAELAPTLSAISAGAVFMGANTYLGNAPNFMVRAIAENQGVRMPGFFGYMLWSLCILIPCFMLLTRLFFA